ncbi:MAG: hypothetical protein ABIT76_12230 [Chthoniobacterales bacterium]
MRSLNSILCVLLFLAGLVGTALFIGRKLPSPYVVSVSEKIRWLQKHGDQYDTLFIGSSRVNRHIRADLFDEAMAAAGHPTRSFNLGVNGMCAPEDTYVLEAALAKRKKPLKNVVVEYSAIPIESASDRGAETIRKSYWLDPKRFQSVMRRLWTLTPREIAVSNRWDSFTYATRRFVSRELNLGRGLKIVQARFEKSPKSLKQTFQGEWQGYEVLRQKPLASSQWKIFQERVADLAQTPATSDYGSSADLRELAEKRRLIESFGGRMIVYIPPLAYRRNYAPDPKLMGDVPVMDFSNPKLYPDFYDRKLLADINHFNDTGAELFTKEFAQQFLLLK